jgi:hypothetical protein
MDVFIIKSLIKSKDGLKEIEYFQKFFISFNPSLLFILFITIFLLIDFLKKLEYQYF